MGIFRDQVMRSDKELSMASRKEEIRADLEKRRNLAAEKYVHWNAYLTSFFSLVSIARFVANLARQHTVFSWQRM